MWPNGYFTSSAVVVARHRRPHLQLSLSSTTVRQYIKNPHLHILPVTSADFLCKIYLQFTRCNIHSSAFYHWPILKTYQKLSNN